MEKLYNKIIPNHRKKFRDNLIYTSQFLNDEYIEHGKKWYIDNNNLIKDISNEYQILDIDKTAQLFSVFSSNTKYERNVDEVYRILKLVKNNIKIDLDKHRKWQTKSNWEKALPLFEGKDVFITRNKAKKTYSFYRNLMLDNNYITIDTHHIKAMVYNTVDWKKILSNNGIYEDLETITKKVSIPYLKKYNINYYEFQASLWVLIRDRYKHIKHGIQSIPTKVYTNN